MSTCDECLYGCDDFHNLESTNAILTRRVTVLEKMVIEMMGEGDKSYREVRDTLVDEWLSERGLQRKSVL